MEFSRARVYGPWSLTLQQDLPIYWIKCPPLSSYFLRLKVSFSESVASDECNAGVIIHGRGDYTKVNKDDSCVVSSNGLGYESATTSRAMMRFRREDEWHIIVDRGEIGLFFRDRKVHLKTSFKYNSGRIGLFNLGKGSVNFSDILVTAYNR